MRPFFASGQRPSVNILVPHISMYGVEAAILIADLEARPHVSAESTVVTDGRVYHVSSFPHISGMYPGLFADEAEYMRTVNALAGAGVLYMSYDQFGGLWLALDRNSLYGSEEIWLERMMGLPTLTEVVK
jgi:hypothetical protein